MVFFKKNTSATAKDIAKLYMDFKNEAFITATVYKVTENNSVDQYLDKVVKDIPGTTSQSECIQRQLLRLCYETVK